MLAAQVKPAERIRRGGGVWLPAIISALALLLAPATAVAQQDPPPSIVEVHTTSSNITDSDWIMIHFDEDVIALVKDDYRVTYNGVLQTIVAVGYEADGDDSALGIEMASRIPNGAVVIVSYTPPETLSHRLQSRDKRYVESFTWDVTANRQIPLPPEQAVYLELGRYFSGAGSLSSTERFVDSYFEDLLAKVAEGGLSDDFNIGEDDEQRSAWGTEGTEDWAQIGSGAFPRRFCYVPPGATEERCVDTQAEWGWGTQYQCGGRPQPGLHDNDYMNFFWACTGDGQWVPVKRHRPGIDYSHDSDLIRPDPNQNVGRNDPDGTHDGTPNEVPDAAKCLFRDEDGNLAPVFRADFHPPDHQNPQLAGKPIRDANGNVQGTTIHGRNWDPIAKVCRGS